ncbi:MAG: pseudouridylate synthase, partial [Geobacteraceae bacterium]|nr:pseudouridylate synthase [Geobacteraceae bacterium]
GDGRHNRLFRSELGCGRLLLHAAAYSFLHPWSGETVTITAPLDDAFAAVMERIGWRGRISPALRPAP